MKNAIIKGILSALLLTTIVLIIVFYQFEMLSWRLLWLDSFWGLPFVVIILVVILSIGILIGLIPYQTQKKELRIIRQAHEQITSGKTEGKIRYYGQEKETEKIIQLINQLQKQLSQTTKRMQEVIGERIEDQEEQIEARLTEERNRLARELHDSVSQELFAASMLVSAINEMTTDGQSGDLTRPLAQVEQMIQKAQLEMRALLLHLRPIALKNHSLSEGINQLLSELVEKIPIKIQWRAEDIALNRAVEDNLFRILQESLSNALRHSKANQIDVLLMARDGMAILSVVDDGIGFDPDTELSGSYGLANMKERTTEIGGQFRMVSLPNQGTKLTVNVPINSER